MAEAVGRTASGQIKASLCCFLVLLGCKQHATDEHVPGEFPPTAAQSTGSDTLDLTNRVASDEDLLGIEKAATLREIHIGESGVTRQGLAVLSSLTNIEVLALGQTPLSDEDVQGLPHFEKLRDLRLPASELTDAGVARLVQDIPQIERLVLGSSEVTSEAIRELQQLPRLRGLILIDAPIGDEGLRLLAKMSQLDYLYLRNVVGSPEAADELAAAIPHFHAE